MVLIQIAWSMIMNARILAPEWIAWRRPQRVMNIMGPGPLIAARPDCRVSGCRDLRFIVICPLRDRAVRLHAELPLVNLRDERSHQLAVANRPRGRSAHRLMDESLHRRAVEIGAVHHQLDGVRYRLARDRANEREQRLRSETVAPIEDREAHDHSFSVAASGAAGAVLYGRVP